MKQSHARSTCLPKIIALGVYVIIVNIFYKSRHCENNVEIMFTYLLKFMYLLSMITLVPHATTDRIKTRHTSVCSSVIKMPRVL
jgi:hypothetical protein